MTYITVPLSRNHNRTGFSCGKPDLDIYIHQRASQDIKNQVAVCFVYPFHENEIIGYYTLSNGSISPELIPQEIKRKMPKYSYLPVTLLGRFAINEKFQAKGYGELLLIDALERCHNMSAQCGSIAVVVDPLDDSAIGFYNRYGFITLPGSMKMFLPMKTISKLF